MEQTFTNYFDKSANITNFAKALSVFHSKMADVKKESNNPYFNSKYAGLDSILPAIKTPLHDSGLVFTQIPYGDDELITLIVHSESGEFIQGRFQMKPTRDDPQGRGSTLTYMRRYSLVSMLGLNTDEDDDGNKASEKPKVGVKSTQVQKAFGKKKTPAENFDDDLDNMLK